MLIGNYSPLNKTPGSFYAGASISNTKGGYTRSSKMMNRFYGEGLIRGSAEKCSVPNGYRPPYSWVLAPKEGGMGSNTMIKGETDIAANLAGGRNIEASMGGSTAITDAALGLILSAVATIGGSTGLSADVIGKLEASATLAGSGNIAGALGALAGAVAQIGGSSAMSGSMTGKGNMSADLTPFTELSPQALAAAVWGALAAQFNESGTMGEKLNGAGSAGDPWTTDLDGYITEGTAGKVLKDKLATDDFLALK